MRLLIVTQAVDLDDPVLGFFHRWIEECAKLFERVEVICLKEGRHALPDNVSVHSLGKPSFAKATKGNGARLSARIRYIANFYRYTWMLRKTYDAVFVHMNEEYVLLGGAPWRLSKKRVVLWRNHPHGSWRTRVASRLVHTVCYTSPEAYVARFRNAVQMPIGIDTDFFSPGAAPLPRSILFLGRLDAVKRPDLFLAALELLDRNGVEYHADVYGDPTPGHEAYADELKRRFAHLPHVAFHPSVRNNETPVLYHSHAVYVNLTPAGSFDKTIGEAMSCGALVVCVNDAVAEVIPANVLAGRTAERTAAAIEAALEFPASEQYAIGEKQRNYILAEHSLPLLIERLVFILEQ